MEFTLKDAVWLASLVVSVTGAYWRLRMMMQSLEDRKANKETVEKSLSGVTDSLNDLKVTLARIEGRLPEPKRIARDERG